ncbi:bifunctional transcriptional activator/DNA repair enzyme AdaA [Chromobacterium sp. IIBBL 290-4]|uniref:bifunctional transcriptional activator/DNA repair enzyme AdaA n=1 Tax=Chromobacterium sp. IIBBL 290-4 TaxID=2953890 RepID=UPI0020B6FC77|nr:AlkA N-terminal domain-containing protein [Chromobacterium sp. IIBBL 290-4]UTH75614.1 helix-turn-helix domain-containing protein [Chromobacterium sp. IIBBL 290-4]
MELDPDFCHRALASRDARFDGRFFIGVRSTGIYCRPICPARTAKRENIVVYATAAAAQEAGFRPCLRCRPEAAPDSGAWRGVANSGHSHTVAKALALIEQGALDEDGIARLADRLGVGERQLRRLFAEHAGASPLAVAQTRRVLLAKQLIHETHMPLTDIAFAAGFGSVRRFNEVFQQLYQRPPSALRRDASAQGGAPGEVSLRLRYRPPYHWPDMLAQLAAQAVPGLEAIQDNRYARAVHWRGVTGMLSVTQTDGSALLATLRISQWQALSDILARLRAMLDLAADPDCIASHLSQDPVLAERIADRPGLRLLGAWSAAEAEWKQAGTRDEQAEWLARHGHPLAAIAADFPAIRYAFPQTGQLDDTPRPADPDHGAASAPDLWRPWRAYAQRYGERV